jgi:hypothetical protein
MIIHLIDGTYELFRHYYGLRRLSSKGLPFGAVAGVLGTVIQMLEEGATHIGVATDHIIESFRNDLWPGYKTGLGIELALHAQFVPLEKALVAMGVATWPMVELEADDALASAANIAAQDPVVEKVCIWTPTRISPSAYRARALCRSIAGAGRFATTRACARSSVSRHRTSPTTLRSSATQRTVILGFRKSEPRRPQD